MKRTMMINFLITIVFLGCSHTSVVRTDSARFMQLQQESKKKKAKVTLKNGQFYLNVRLTRLTSDSTSWILQNGEIMSAPTKGISEIRFVNRGKGALEGLGLGLLGGILSGAVIGLAAGGDGLLFTDEGAAILGAIGFGGFGGLLGIPVGVAVGSRNKYQFQVPDKLSISRRPIAMTTENLKLWKENILNLFTFDSKIRKTWKEYAKFHNLNKDRNAWVNSLHESDFQDFAGSGKRLRDWLIFRFSKRQTAAGNY